MAVVHSRARMVDPVTGSYVRLSPEMAPNGRLASRSGPRRRGLSPALRPERPVRMPVAPPPGHDVPGVALELGHLVAYLRENLPLREEQAAYRAWVTPEYWRAIENGKRLPSLAVFIMLARALGLDPRELLDQLLERMHYGRGAPPVIQPSRHAGPRGSTHRSVWRRIRVHHGQPWALRSA